MIDDPEVRQSVAPQSFAWFFPTYFGHYVKHETADFHREMFRIGQSDTIQLAIILAFRGSAKSTIFSLAYPIWSIIGRQRRKFVLILTENKDQARILMANLRNEMDYNEMLKRELGPFEDGDQWGAMSVVIPKYRARIMVASSEQAIRGIRHWENRPDLIIADDVESLESVKTLEQRDKDYAWFTGEIIPLGDLGTKIIMIGNMLHEDSLLMRLSRQIDENKRSGIVRRYPLVDEQGQILWKSKFPNMEAVETLRRTIVDEVTWYREYLLKILSPSNQVIKPEWLEYYDPAAPPEIPNYRHTATGIDLAISLRETANRTAMVSAKIYGNKDTLRIMILPNPVNERLDFPRTLEKAKCLSRTLAPGQELSKLFIEDVAYQASIIQQLKDDGFPAESVAVGSMDKRERLSLVSTLVETKKVLFPKRGAEELIAQITGFGFERCDDLADAFSTLLFKIRASDKPRPHRVVGNARAMYDRCGVTLDDLDPSRRRSRW
ncbi:MAG: hypothetical protein V1778_05265 [bacterium]